MKQKAYDVIVIGAGAAGLIAAGRAAEFGLKVLVLEKMERAGRKLLITGKGRCNISNDSSMDEYFKNIFPNGRFLRTAFHSFFSPDIVALLETHGLKTQTERGNRIFPETNKAADVLKAIMKWIDNLSIHIRFNTAVVDLMIESGHIAGVEVNSGSGTEKILSKSVIVATGGKSYPATGSSGDGYKFAKLLGHTVVPPRPALAPLVTSGKEASALQGLSLKNVNAVLWVNGKKVKEEFGEMMFTHFGLTGPIILTLSRRSIDEIIKKNKVEICIDLKPALDEAKLDKRLLRDLDENGKRFLENTFKLWMPQKLIPVFLEILKLDGKTECHQMTSKQRKQLVYLLKNFRFNVIDYRGFKEAIITAGGVSTQEIDSKTMESKLISNLYFAGEVIDLDANTGGFNLQIAFSTGWLAGASAARAVSEIA
ncbi:MAG: NAD(P)/FAD-dependent oxidoreductase [Bacteroidales bacterium]|nr:NAD(P)/FAD-dependent oxidoreductase [Bacteroidales bacterium]MCF8390213.1 NAD(P)/FAD-dependent oxidoreductase [Bacteroidales bacterium]